MDAIDIKRRTDGVDGVDLCGDIVIPDDIDHRSIGGFPGYNENGNPLVDAIFDKAFFGRQIEDIEAVDPRREYN